MTFFENGVTDTSLTPITPGDGMEWFANAVTLDSLDGDITSVTVIASERYCE